MKTGTFILLVAAIFVGALVANLIALKIAADEASKQISAATSNNPLLNLLK